MLGAAIGALFNGWLSFRLGRKYSLMAGAVLFLWPALSDPLLPPAWRGAAGGPRGAGRGSRDCLYTAPLYLSEMASENVRGKMIGYVSADGHPWHCAGVFRYRL